MDSVLNLGMEQVLHQLRNIAVAKGFNYAINLGSSSVMQYLSKLSKDDRQLLENTRQRLTEKLNVILPVIETLELVAARGNSKFSYVSETAASLRAQIEAIDEDFESLANSSKKPDRHTVDLLNAEMLDLMKRLDEKQMLLMLSLQLSGASMSARLGQSFSPGRLLQASKYLNAADEEFERQLRKSRGKPVSVAVGPPVRMRLYSVFLSSSRPIHSPSDIPWREEFAVCYGQLFRISSQTSDEKFRYALEIKESFDDERYHDDDEEPKRHLVDLQSITRLFFAPAGRLLHLDDASSPVLVAKLNKSMSTYASAVDVYWIGLRELEEDEVESESDSEYDSQNDSGSDIATRSSDAERSDYSSNVDELSQRMRGVSISTKYASISLLEYLLRLSALQQNDQQHVEDIPDERIALYLRDDDEQISDTPVQHADWTQKSPYRDQNAENPSTPERARKVKSGSPSPQLTPWEADRMKPGGVSLRKKALKKNPVLRHLNESPTKVPRDSARRKASS